MRLRQDTRICHDRVDDVFGKLDFTTREGVCTFLQWNLRAYSCLDEWCRQSCLLLPERSTMIEEDLNVLGFESETNSLTPPDQPADPEGVAYVVLGSTMGARVLRKIWQTSTDETVLRAGRFLCDNSLDIPCRDLMASLKSQPHLGEKADRMVETAIQTFDVFLRSSQQAEQTEKVSNLV
ncbi:MAG: hypothetical protein CMK07_11470 [Ponticaulis sp.]|nr:hypothetical protein [Ponticaulis sp.]